MAFLGLLLGFHLRPGDYLVLELTLTRPLFNPIPILTPSLIQTTLLPEFAKTAAPKSFTQYEHLLKKSKSTEGYFVYDHVSLSTLLSALYSFQPTDTLSLPSLSPCPSLPALHLPSLLTQQPSFAEYHLYYIVYAITRLHPTILSSFPLLDKWYTLMSSRSNIAAYIKSGKRKQQLNGSPSGDNPCVSDE